MGVQIRKLGQLTTTAMPQFERFQSGAQPTLLFAEQTIEQQNAGFQFVRRNLQPGDIPQARDRLDAAAHKELPAADRIAGGIEIEARHALPCYPAMLDEVIERVLHFDMQALGRFFGRIALGGMLHPGFGGGEQRAVTREPDSLMRLQPIGVEAGDLTQRVVTSAMGIAGEIVELFQFSEDGQVHLGCERALEFVEGGLFGLEQVLTQDVTATEGWSHNVMVPI
jgi:hypothetical protein